MKLSKELLLGTTVHAIKYIAAVEDYFKEYADKVLYEVNEQILYLDGMMFSLKEIKVYGMDRVDSNYSMYNLKFVAVSKEEHYRKQYDIDNFRTYMEELYLGKDFKINSKYGLYFWEDNIKSVTFGRENKFNYVVGHRSKQQYNLTDVILL